MRNALSTWLVLVLAVVFAPACGSSAASASGGDEIEAVPFKSTVMLDVEDLATLAKDDESGALVFANAPHALDAIARGQVIVAPISPSTPKGLLRVVRGVSRSGASLTLDTLNAPIQLAFSKLHMKVQERSSGPIGALSGAPNDVSPRAIRPLGDSIQLASADAGTTLNVDFMLFDADGDPTTKDDQVEITGSLGGQVKLTFSLDFDWGAVEDRLPDIAVACVESLLLGPESCLLSVLPEAKVDMKSDADVKGSVRVEGAAVAEFDDEIDLLDVPFEPIMLGPVPLLPVVTVTADLGGGASAGFAAGASAEMEATSGVAISSRHLDTPSVDPPQLVKKSFDAQPPGVTLQAQAKVALGAKSSILVAGVTGPYAKASVFAQIGADVTQNPCWHLDAGIEAKLGLLVRPTLPFIGAVTLFDWSAPPFSVSVPILNGACSIPPDTSTLPPGSGADATHFANPSFTPWARLVSSPLDGSFAGSPTNEDLLRMDLQRTIDGLYLVTGDTVTVPHKIDAKSATVKPGVRYLSGATPLAVRRAIENRDATLTYLTSGASSDAFGLLHVGERGGIYDHRLFTVGDADCAPEPRALAPDGSGGAYVLASCSDRKRALLARVAKDGSVLFAITLDDPAGGAITPTALVPSSGDVVVGGELSTGAGQRLFLARLDGSGTLKVATTYTGCAEAPDVSPTSGMASPNGDVTFAGSSSAHHLGFLGRFKPDGAVAFASFPSTGVGASKVLVATSVGELPTTGYVVGGSTVDLLGDAVTTTPAVALVGLDAIGHVLWSKRVTVLDGAQPSASGFGAVRLADDGGVVVAAMAAPAAGSTDTGRLFAFEAVAKDGSLAGLDPAHARIDDLGATDQACSLSGAPWAAHIAPIAVSGSSSGVTSEPVTPSVTNATR